MKDFWAGLALSILIEFLPLLVQLLRCRFTQDQPGAFSKTSPSRPRILKPRSPLDCPCCQAAIAHNSSCPSNLTPSVPPWSQLKSRRGLSKTIPTQGFACPHPKCQYFGMIDQSLHALVADGKHGKNEAIQTFKCQACQTTFTSRRYTPLYRLKTPCSKVGQVLMAMAEGVDLAAAERIFGHRSTTIASWLCRAGQHGQLLHQQTFLNLPLPHLQLDEIRTRLRCRSQVVWLW